MTEYIKEKADLFRAKFPWMYGMVYLPQHRTASDILNPTINIEKEMVVFLESSLQDLSTAVEECIPEERETFNEPGGCECGGDSRGAEAREVNGFRTQLLENLKSKGIIV